MRKETVLLRRPPGHKNGVMNRLERMQEGGEKGGEEGNSNEGIIGDGDENQ